MKLYNSLGKKYDPLFVSSDKIKVYLCGPTVQSPPHLGHGKSAVSFDVLIRFIRSLDKEVLYVRNVTDIDDKIIAKAKEEGVDYKVVVEKNSKLFHESFTSLNCLAPDFEPKATEHIEEIIDLISKLLEKDYAYLTNSGVYFDVEKYPRYMELSRRNIEEAIAGERIPVDENKKSKEDFALWKIAKDGEPYWNSPWGKGRPGWHIECSAMAKTILGLEIDIHCGGNDLIFPHHENEIAQSQAGYGIKTFSRLWLHNGMLRLDGKKMSKSTGHVKSLSEYIDIYGGEVIRFFFLRSHYRSPQEFSEELLKETQVTLSNIKEVLIDSQKAEPDKEIIEKFNTIMKDDLNTPKVIALIFDEIKNIKKNGTGADKIKSSIKEIMNVLGFELTSIQDSLEDMNLSDLSKEFGISGRSNNELINNLVSLRDKYRFENDFNKSDEIREKLLSFNIELEDSPERTRWFWNNS